MSSRGEAFEMSATRPMGGYVLDSKDTGAQVTVSGRKSNERMNGILRVRKLFSSTQIFAFSLTYMCTWEVLTSQMMFALWNGGPQTYAWATLIAYFGAAAQAASLAEMASSVPIAGAQYHWTNALAPPRIKRFTTWLQGWITWFGWVSVLAAYINLDAIVLQAMVSLQHETYVPQNWHTALIMIAFLLVFGLVNSMRWTFVFVPWLELLAGILHVALFVLFIVVLMVMGSRNSTDYIFFHREIWSGWDSNSALSWHLGMLTCVGSFISLDGTVHMAEETRVAKKAVPRAVFWGVVLNGAMGFAMVVCVLSAMGPMDEELAYAPYPLAVVLMRTTKSADASTAMLCGILVIFACSGLGCVASVSRLTWAWSRDGGLPRWFAMVDAKHLLPIRAIWLGLALNIALSLINVGSSAAYGAILSLATISLFTSYGIAIFSMLAARWRSHQGQQVLELGEWNMGRYGVFVNLFALLYTAYMAIFLPIPYSLPVTAVNMNYAGPIFVAGLIFVLSSWYLWGRKRWPGIDNDIVEFVKEHAEASENSRTA
ncbi:uncharacterized protein HMPREF1541_10736 [Cyphellophora europaea CBS 101466]|uniref:Uncharacterized protein n=1 Tax=Cyphellophora europaea (strain CBS 101466) TaxID=1220924 RepID=W2S649_CYPE1|nr:uncharacterized protein HMPREF1541_10736 [Cyphellophora europaea CBS 101466]ETN44186.1 hypothetical protein HMPREF1541_10736 [Cyphellophora europaea CBS 101466]